MSGYIGKSRYLFTRRIKQCKQIIKAKRNTANTRHTESLLYTTWSDKASRHTHTHKPKRKEIKETSLKVRWLPPSFGTCLLGSPKSSQSSQQKAPTPTTALSLRRRRRTNQAQQRRRRTNFHTTTTNEPGSDTTTNQLQPLSACPHAHFITRGPASWDRLVLGWHAPSGRAFSLSANRDSRHAPCSST